MSKKNEIKIDLRTYDEVIAQAKDDNKLSFFNTLEAQDKKDRTLEVPLSLIDGFPNHPFKVVNDEAMQELVQSIKENGLINPAIVRKKEDGRYELVSGHRRKMACELAGMTTMTVIVRDMDRDEAAITMVDSNLQRERILPSEKAFAYKMRLEAMRRKVGRPRKENSDPVGPDLIGTRSNEELAQMTGESATQIKRYIRLTELIPDILNMVDEKQVGLQPAVALSYLSKEEQQYLLETMQSEERTPSLAQAQRMKQLSAEGRLTEDVIFAIMTEEKPNEKEKLTIPRKTIEPLLPKGLSRDKEVEYIMKALELYQKFLQRQKQRNFER